MLVWLFPEMRSIPTYLINMCISLPFVWFVVLDVSLLFVLFLVLDVCS